jgi:hypothetical protein
MKKRVAVLMSAVTLLALLTVPMRPAARENGQSSERAGQLKESAANPVPLINQPLVPDAVAPGGPDFTLTVNGTGFVSGSVVQWNGTALATTFVSGSQLTATVPASDITVASTDSVTVVNPSPAGGTSPLVPFPVTSPTRSVSFVNSIIPAGTSTPLFATVGDFNRDGKLDVAVTNDGANISVLLGNGDGTFQSPVSYAAGQMPLGIVTADLNGDGNLDLAVVDQIFGSSSVSVLLGNGDGTFRVPLTATTGSESAQVVAADLNGDGKLDLAVTNADSTTVSILLGNGNGTFQKEVQYNAGFEPNGIATGDLNGDGRLDLVVSDFNLGTSGDVAVLLGNGDGTFQAPVQYTTGNGPTSVVAADFNGDGKLDLAVANYNPYGGNGSGSVSILLGNGDGSFQAQVPYTTGNDPTDVVVGDLNGDGKLDVVAADTFFGTVSVLFGNGDGTFQNHSDFPTAPSPYSVAIGDFNRDGRLDLVTPNGSGTSNDMYVLLQVPPNPAVTLSPTSLSFGTQLVGTASAAQTVSLTNTGSATLDITSIAASTHFLEGSTCASSLAAGASCTIHVKFRPSGIPGTENGTLTVTDNAPRSPQTVSLSGVGTAVSLSPTSVNFGNQPVGTTSGPQTVTLTNHAKGTLSIFVVAITGTNASDFAQTNTCGGSVTAGSSCTFSITFTPGAKGSRTATLNIRDDGGASPQTVSLSGTGT